MRSHNRGISRGAKGLLASGESKLVEYKERVKGLSPEDLVAFANSDDGGTILIGVREIKAAGGRQIGEPIGHPIDDDTRLQIMGKALSCTRVRIVIVKVAFDDSKCEFNHIERVVGVRLVNKPLNATSVGTPITREFKNSLLARNTVMNKLPSAVYIGMAILTADPNRISHDVYNLHSEWHGKSVIDVDIRPSLFLGALPPLREEIKYGHSVWRS